jgi:uncharacterized membrane protein
MPIYVDIVNKILSIGTIFLQFFVVSILLALVFFKKRDNTYLVLIKKYTFIMGFFAALGAFL